MKTKTASVRLPQNMYEEIDNVCDGIGCTRNDWIKDTLKDKLRTQINENPQDLQIKVEDVERPKPTVTIIDDEKPRSEGIITRVSYDDGETWDDIPELRNVTVSD
ncbi:MAG: hypothetical protein COA77_06355 [Thaumarchaeota archaeon]|nr:MAG: hypothetical protein COA77_06355 [Nitrososphaerota archaeon]